MLNAQWLSRSGSTNLPVLFLHGFMGTLDDWKVVAAGLERDALGVDLPGHGGSVNALDEHFSMEGVVDAIMETLDEMGTPSIDLVGYSMGGRIALALACKYPDCVGSLVLESTHPGIGAEPERRKRLALDRARANRLCNDFDGFLTEWFDQPVFSSLRRRPDLLQTLRQQRITQQPDALARALLGFSPGHPPVHPDTGAPGAAAAPGTPATTGHRAMPRIPGPVAYICGALDAKYLEIGQHWAARPPGPRLHVIEQAGHNVHLEAPDAYLATLTSILSST